MRPIASSFAALVVAVSVAAGCRAVLAIEDRPLSPDGDASQGPSGGDSGDVAAPSDGEPEPETDAELTVDGAADVVAPVDRAWSRWAIGPAFPSPASFSVQGDVVYDAATGLVWQRDLGLEARSFADAQKACDALTLGGFSDWRVPTRIELASIVHYDTSPPATMKTEFFDTPLAPLWTSSPYAGSPTQAWACDFLSGAFSPHERTAAYRVRCVRG